MRAMNALGAGCLLAASAWPTAQADDDRDLGRATLHLENGWAASVAGITGGAAAIASTSPSNISSAPEIIYVTGSVDANVDHSTHLLDCIDCQRDSYALESLVATRRGARSHQRPPAWTPLLTTPLFAGPMAL